MAFHFPTWKHSPHLVCTSAFLFPMVHSYCRYHPQFRLPSSELASSPRHFPLSPSIRFHLRPAISFISPSLPPPPNILHTALQSCTVRGAFKSPVDGGLPRWQPIVSIITRKRILLVASHNIVLEIIDEREFVIPYINTSHLFQWPV